MTTTPVGYLRRNAARRWVIANVQDGKLGWSGLTWVPMTSHGYPAGQYQIANFPNEEEATSYASTAGIKLAVHNFPAMPGAKER